MEFKTKTDRIWLENPQGDTVAYVQFPAKDANTVEVVSTFVDTSLRGQGVANQLLQALCRELRTRGKNVIPTCSYAAAWFLKHPEEADLLSPER